MAIQFNLEKSTQALQFSLEKNNVGKINPCQVHVAMDTSGSFYDEHEAGYTQQLLNRLVPFSMLFDKDKVLDSISFACEAVVLPEITERNYATYIKKHVPWQRGGTTDYADAFRLMIESTEESTMQQVTKSIIKPATGFLGKLFGKKTVEEVTENVAVGTSYAEDKHLFFFITDGSPNSQSEAQQALSQLMKDNVFIVFISISRSRISFLERFAKEPYAMYLNYTPNQLRTLQDVTDEQLYDQFLAAPQLVAWMNK